MLNRLFDFICIITTLTRPTRPTPYAHTLRAATPTPWTSARSIMTPLPNEGKGALTLTKFEGQTVLFQELLYIQRLFDAILLHLYFLAQLINLRDDLLTHGYRELTYKLYCVPVQ